MSKYTRLINVISFDNVTRFLCSDWLKCRITLQSDLSIEPRPLRWQVVFAVGLCVGFLMGGRYQGALPILM